MYQHILEIPNRISYQKMISFFVDNNNILSTENLIKFLFNCWFLLSHSLRHVDQKIYVAWAYDFGKDAWTGL